MNFQLYRLELHLLHELGEFNKIINAIFDLSCVQLIWVV